MAPVPGLELRSDGPLTDRFGRRHTYLRVSVTDRCNFRCTYCMPAEGLDWKRREDLLTFEEIRRIAAVFVGMGIRRIRLTGGEPLVRKGIVELVGALSSLGLDDLAMTTNGHLLGPLAGDLAAAGLRRVNVSCDAVDPEVFRTLTRTGDVGPVLAGIDAARVAGLLPVKVNAVVVGGVNEHQVLPMVEHFAAWPSDIEVRFIEYMPFGALRHQHVPAARLREMFAERFTLEPIGRGPGGPAVRWRLAETGQVVGFISPITEHFCEACNRLRLDADGHLRTCLSRDDAPSLLSLLRGGADEVELGATLRRMVWGKVAGHTADQLDGVAFEGVMTRIGG